MRKKLLNEVAQMLIGLKPHEIKHFTMDIWCEKRGCATVGCAAGFAVTKGLLPKVVARKDGGFDSLMRGQEDWEEIPILEHRFDLSQNDVDYLFLPDAYEGAPHPYEVAGRILRFVKEEGQPVPEYAD